MLIDLFNNLMVSGVEIRAALAANGKLCIKLGAERGGGFTIGRDLVPELSGVYVERV